MDHRFCCEAEDGAAATLAAILAIGCVDVVRLIHRQPTNGRATQIVVFVRESVKKFEPSLVDPTARGRNKLEDCSFVIVETIRGHSVQVASLIKYDASKWGICVVIDIEGVEFLVRPGHKCDS